MNILQLLGIGAPSSDPMAALASGTGTIASAPSGFGDFSGAAPQPVDPGIANILQTMSGGNADASLPPSAPPQPVATQPARSRSSLLDRIGRVADVIATVGGAHPLYQPTLDERQDRALALGDHDRSVTGTLLNQQLTGQQLTAGQGTIADAAAARVQRVAQAMQAIRAKNPQADINSIFPLLAKQNGIPDDQIATISQEMANNPDLIDGLAGRQDLGKNLYSAEGPDGKKLLYQVGPDGVAHFLQMGSDVTPDALHPKVVNTGGSTVVLGDDGKPISTIGNTARPDTVLTTGTQRDIAASRNSTAENVARIRAGATTDAAKIRAGAKGGAANGFTVYNEARSGLTDLVHSLDGIINDPDLGSATGIYGSIAHHIPGTAAARVAGNIATTKGQALVSAINHMKALSGNGNLGFRLTQQEAIAIANQMTGALGNTNQSAGDYRNNLVGARQRLLQEIGRMDQDALTKGYIRPHSDAPAAPAAPARRILSTSPLVKNWGN